MEIVAIGAGALGSWTLDFLAKRLKALSIVIPIRIIDFDEVDDRNYANQFFTLEHKGKSKAEIVAERVRGYGLEAIPVVEKIDENNVESLIDPEKTKVMLDMVDNAEARTLAWLMSVKHDIACMHAGVSKAGHGMSIWTAKDWDHYFNMGLKGRLQGNSKQGAEKAADEKLPPCEMLEFGMLCLQTSMSSAKATSLYFGKDPDKVFGGSEPPEGTMVCFKSLPEFHQVDSSKKVRVHGEPDQEEESEDGQAEKLEEGEGEKQEQEEAATTQSEG